MGGLAKALAAQPSRVPGGDIIPADSIMSTDNRIVLGVVKNGVVVPHSGNELPDGAYVNIVLQPAEMPQERREEIAAWQRAGNQSWQMIDKWEADEQ